MFKATQEVDNLVFKQEINYIKEQASQRSYENLENSSDVAASLALPILPCAKEASISADDPVQMCASGSEGG